MNPRLSAVIIVKDEAANLPACLESVRFANEIVVVDSGSADGSQEICRKFGAHVVEQPFLGYGPQKNFGVGRATGEWILSVDADERVPETLREEILSVIALPQAMDGYQVARRNFFGDTWIRHGGWYPDMTVRLFRRGKGRFKERRIHESVVVEGAVGTLRGALDHYTCRDFAAFEQRQEKYAKLIAAEMARDGRTARATDVWLRPPFTFVNKFFLKAGFLDGGKGLALALLYTRYTRRKYQRLIELRAQSSAGQ